MGFLRILCLGLVYPGLFRNVIRSVVAADMCTTGFNGFICHLHTIGTHIGDQTNGLTIQRHTFV